ncbi:MAG: EAL domain-containing protein [Myxococcales bacterium]|nr:EAL domain-containing protein [Myxococcales bacterium]
MKDIRAGQPGRVLVVDDDAQVRQVLCRVLQRSGLQVMPAESGTEAIAILEHEPVDAVVSDINMPGYDGITLLREIRRTNLDLPVILITGLPTADTAIHALQYGALNYLSKPIDNTTLVSEVRRAVQLFRIAELRRASSQELGMAVGVPDLAGLEVSFDSALKELFMVYQPVVRWSDRSVYGYETLVRSAEPSLPHPGALLDAAERLGRLFELSRRIRDLAVAPLASNDALLLLNLHTRDLLDPELYEASAPMARYADRVILEITERARLEDVGDPRPRVASLRSLGYRIAIDDIGAGYSGLTSFATLAPDLLKIDMSLVRQVHASPIKQRLVSALVNLCNDLAIPLVAEGVEDTAERDALLELGLDLFQGYWFARPGAPFPVPRFT